MCKQGFGLTGEGMSDVICELPVIHCLSMSTLLDIFFEQFGFLYFIIYANLVILTTPVRIISYQVVSLGHLGGFVAF